MLDEDRKAFRFQVAELHQRELCLRVVQVVRLVLRVLLEQVQREPRGLLVPARPTWGEAQ